MLNENPLHLENENNLNLEFDFSNNFDTNFQKDFDPGSNSNRSGDQSPAPSPQLGDQASANESAQSMLTPSVIFSLEELDPLSRIIHNKAIL
jgi:hypothetical protein